MTFWARGRREDEAYFPKSYSMLCLSTYARWGKVPKELLLPHYGIVLP